MLKREKVTYDSWGNAAGEVSIREEEIKISLCNRRDGRKSQSLLCVVYKECGGK